MAEAATAWIDAVAEGARAASGTELAAVVSGFAYIVLAIRGHRVCWIAGGASSALFVVVFARAALPMQAALQVLYVALAVYGWRSWRPGGALGDRPVSWPLSAHGLAAAAVVVASAASIAVMADRPFPAAVVGDAVGTCASVAATVMLARRCRESWLWWIAIDFGLAGFFGAQGLAFTSALYLAFAMLAIVGWRAWRRKGARAR